MIKLEIPEENLKFIIRYFNTENLKVSRYKTGLYIISKMIHLSLEPLKDIFKVENNLTLEAISVSFFAIPGKVDATIYDCSGRKIKDKFWVYSKELLPGIYFLQVKQEKFWIFTGKIVKL